MRLFGRLVGLRLAVCDEDGEVVLMRRLVPYMRREAMFTSVAGPVNEKDRLDVPGPHIVDQDAVQHRNHRRHANAGGDQYRWPAALFVEDEIAARRQRFDRCANAGVLVQPG
jgi:hypothetical protein